MMANAEHAELKSSLSEENEASQSLTELETNTQTLEEVNAMAPSFGDEKCFLVEGAEGTETQDKRIMDEKISPIERQLEYLLNKADEFQTQLLWSRECLQNYGFAHVVPMFLQTCQPYFTYLESTARNSNPFRPPLSTYIRTQLLQFSQQLCSRLEQLVLLYASFSFFSLEESDPLSISHFYIGQCQIDNMKLSIFCYFLCCEDVIEAADDKDGDGRCEGENTETERESRVERIWSIGRWIQTYPDPDTEDITDWVLCSVPCGQYKQLLCLGSEEPSSCTATDCLMGVLLSQETDGTFGMKT
ncbi:UPF0575 protein C19orf67 homolog isoform X3 [Sinocyclocheilus rhinocerous]|uniref:UPF0575 protein C19orf67 homolog isoform X3 n=1 Tax=Sinocyclocheilus rhinocerous TaxID=307959 RepID=UPI0007B94D2C|nr:PREDICTED: UPF0575 protein C19orf67 homolog isoform X3 [Sinocyclocheilus rhinocerous]